MLFLSYVDFSFRINFFKKSSRNTIRVSNSLDPDQARQNVGPDLGPTVCKSYQQMTKVATSGKELSIFSKLLQKTFSNIFIVIINIVPRR